MLLNSGIGVKEATQGRQGTGSGAHRCHCHVAGVSVDAGHVPSRAPVASARWGSSQLGKLSAWQHFILEPRSGLGGFAFQCLLAGEELL